MSELELTSDVLSPFGPRILSMMLPEHIIQRINDLGDNQQNKINMDGRLAGVIKDEPELTNEEMDSIGIRQIFNDIGKQYVDTILNQNHHFIYDPEKYKINIEFKSGWIVNQKENEYNPVHQHSNCNISSVLYLKVPDFKPRGYTGKKNIDGYIEFINSTVDHSMLSAGSYLVKPEVGKLLMFPSTLLHTVYPFQGPGERRSLAFNLNYKLGE
tara:strand:- start:30 stop:668 length:639 start_codon:yes stop_codon:yes gene_type:complete